MESGNPDGNHGPAAQIKAGDTLFVLGKVGSTSKEG